MTGTRGALTCDFVRSMVVGAGNPGTEALEKMLNPMVGGRAAGRSHGAQRGPARLLGRSYPGLAELIGAFYGAIAARGPSPVSRRAPASRHRLFEQLAARIEARPRAARPPSPSATASRLRLACKARRRVV